MTKKIRITNTDISFGQIRSNTHKYNTNTAVCKNLKFTNAEVKCHLYSNLINVKSVKTVTFPFSSFDFSGFSTDIIFKIDDQFTLTGNYLGQSVNDNSPRTINLDGIAEWALNNNVVNEYSLESAKLTNRNTLEALLPPSSCFNLEMKDYLTTIKADYSAQLRLSFSENDIVLLGTDLESAANNVVSNYNLDNGFITVPISGEITFNVINTDQSQLSPC